MKTSEEEFSRFIDQYLTKANYFSSLILYDSYEDVAWYAALKLGELVANLIEGKLEKQISILLNLRLSDIMDNLKRMGEDDVLCISLNDRNIETLKSYLITKMLNEKKSLIFVSKSENAISNNFKEIVNPIIKVTNLDEKGIRCIINISERGERELLLSMPDKELTDKYHNLRSTLLKETLKRQVPELED